MEHKSIHPVLQLLYLGRTCWNKTFHLNAYSIKLTIFHQMRNSGTTLLSRCHDPWHMSHQHRYSRPYNLGCCMISNNQQFAVRRNYQDVWSYFFVPKRLRLCQLRQTTSTIRTGLDPWKFTVKRLKYKKNRWTFTRVTDLCLPLCQSLVSWTGTPFAVQFVHFLLKIHFRFYTCTYNLRDRLGIVSNWW